MFAIPVLALLLTTTTQDLSDRFKEDAQDARQQLAVAFVDAGQTFRRFGQEARAEGIAVGRAAKTGGIAAGQAVRTLGQAVGEGVQKAGNGVKKRTKKVVRGVKEAVTPDS